MSWDGYIERGKQHIVGLIYGMKTHPHGLRPTSLIHEQCKFFDYWDNRFNGWLCGVNYFDGVKELWLVVYGVNDDTTDDWYIERMDIRGLGNTCINSLVIDTHRV